MLQPAPFSDDPVAIQRREAVKFDSPITHTQAVVVNYSLSRPIRIYCDGVYDLFHYGHAEQHRQIKNAFPNVYLIVGVTTDTETERFKGIAPIINEVDRCKAVSACRFVDEVYRMPPYFADVKFLDKIKADMIAHDTHAPCLMADGRDYYQQFREVDRFLETKYTDGVSTGQIIADILKKRGLP